MRILSKIALSLCLGFFSLKAGKYKDMQKLREQWYDFGSVVFGEDLKKPIDPENITDRLDDFVLSDDSSDSFDDENFKAYIAIEQKIMFKVLLKAVGLFMAYPEKINSWTLDVEEMNFYQKVKWNYKITSTDVENFIKFLNKNNSLDDYKVAKSFLYFRDLFSLRYCEENYLQEPYPGDYGINMPLINFDIKKLDKYFKISDHINVEKLIQNKEIIKKYIESNTFDEKIKNFSIFQYIVDICNAREDHIGDYFHDLIEQLNSFFYILCKKFSFGRIQLPFKFLASNFSKIISEKIFHLEKYNDLYKRHEDLENYKIYSFCKPVSYGLDKKNKLQFLSHGDQDSIFENFLELVDMEKSLHISSIGLKKFSAFQILSYSMIKKDYYCSLNDILFRNNFYYDLFDKFHQGLKFSMLAKNFSKQKNFYVSKIFGTHFIFQIIPYIVGNDVINFYTNDYEDTNDYLRSLYEWTTFYSDDFSVTPKKLCEYRSQYNKRLIFCHDNNKLIDEKIVQILKEKMKINHYIKDTKNVIKQLKFCLYISRQDFLIHKRLFSKCPRYKNLKEQYNEANKNSIISKIVLYIKELSEIFDEKIKIARKKPKKILKEFL